MATQDGSDGAGMRDESGRPDERQSVVSRRGFVERSAVVGAAALFAPQVTRAASGSDELQTSEGGGNGENGGSGGHGREVAPAFAYAERTVVQLQEMMTKGTLTSRALTEAYLARIAAIDAAGPALRSVIERNPDAITIADRMDAERKAGKVRGPLHGIPVLIKDNIDTADKMATTAGSLALAGSSAPRDAHIVERLRAAGAVLLGKTNLSEWANFRSTHSSSGWSGYLGDRGMMAGLAKGRRNGG